MRHDMRKSGSQEINIPGGISGQKTKNKRKRIQKRNREKTEKSPAWMWAELYV